MNFIYLVLLLVGSATSAPHKCGYQSCNPIKKGTINVHLVAHSHDDVGWLKTVDQYYYGSKTKYQNAGVQYILDTVVDSLRKDKSRRFIYVETAFFWKWWIKQHDIVKSRVRKLVYNGQLEFISGGWSMNDEACTHYQSIIDQMTWGLRKLNDTFGTCGQPKMGWQIDPFGHSREMANIFAQLGFDGLMLGRVDYEEKQQRWKTRTPEMVWRGSDSGGEQSDIFTGILYNTYSPPPGFCFDILCGDEPIIDDKKSFEYNVDKRVNDFVEYLNNMTKVYTTDNLLVTMGNDFNYQDAEAWFTNLDKLIYHVNKNQTRYNLLYSTPSCYLKAVHDHKPSPGFPLKTDDFFPYASDPHSFWTGYFTSRPAIKRYERVGNNFLQVCKQLYSLADLGPEDRIDLNYLREAMGIMQHHDAVAGTEKQHVADDYARRLQKGIEECEIITKASINKLLNQTLSLTNCPLLNISQCHQTEKMSEFLVTLYNPLSRAVNKLVRIPISGTSYIVNDNKIPSEVVPIPEFIENIPGRVSVARNELVFLADQIPALGWKHFIVEGGNGITVKKGEGSKVEVKGNVAETSFNINTTTGLLESIQINDLSIPLTQNFYYYKGFVGNNNVAENRSSGAYIFRPNGTSTKVAENVSYKIYRGNLVAELHQTFNDFISQIVRVNAIDNYIEFDWTIGPLPPGMEIVTKYISNIQSQSTFYTDSNGRGTLKRTLNSRPSWNVKLNETISGNYYPITSKISLRDVEKDLELAVLVDRAQGGTSLKDGEIELMLHRNCRHDDAFGVDEALNETAFGRGLVIRGSHFITLGQRSSKTKSHVEARTKDIAQRRLLDTWMFISPPTGGRNMTNNQSLWSGLSGGSLKPAVNLLTLEPWYGPSYLLRLEHVFDVGEDPVWSVPVAVPLKNLFSSLQITSLRETTLGGNQWLSDNHRLVFKINGTLDNQENVQREKRHVVIEEVDPFTIVMNPGQIRTFIIDIQTN